MPHEIGDKIKLHMTRCILCYRCTYVADQITNNRVHGTIVVGQRLGGEGCWTVAQIARGFDIAEDAVEAVVLTLEAGGGLRTDPGTRFVMLTAAAPAPPEPALA